MQPTSQLPTPIAIDFAPVAAFSTAQKSTESLISAGTPLALSRPSPRTIAALDPVQGLKQFRAICADTPLDATRADVLGLDLAQTPSSAVISLWRILPSDAAPTSIAAAANPNPAIRLQHICGPSLKPDEVAGHYLQYASTGHPLAPTLAALTSPTASAASPDPTTIALTPDAQAIHRALAITCRSVVFYLAAVPDIPDAPLLVLSPAPMRRVFDAALRNIHRNLKRYTDASIRDAANSPIPLMPFVLRTAYALSGASGSLYSSGITAAHYAQCNHYIRPHADTALSNIPLTRTTALSRYDVWTDPYSRLTAPVADIITSPASIADPRTASAMTEFESWLISIYGRPGSRAAIRNTQSAGASCTGAALFDHTQLMRFIDCAAPSQIVHNNRRLTNDPLHRTIMGAARGAALRAARLARRRKASANTSANPTPPDPVSILGDYIHSIPTGVATADLPRAGSRVWTHSPTPWSPLLPTHTANTANPAQPINPTLLTHAPHILAPLRGSHHLKAVATAVAQAFDTQAQQHAIKHTPLRHAADTIESLLTLDDTYPTATTPDAALRNVDKHPLAALLLHARMSETQTSLSVFGARQSHTAQPSKANWSYRNAVMQPLYADPAWQAMPCHPAADTPLHVANLNHCASPLYTSSARAGLDDANIHTSLWDRAVQTLLMYTSGANTSDGVVDATQRSDAHRQPAALSINKDHAQAGRRMSSPALLIPPGAQCRSPDLPAAADTPTLRLMFGVSAARLMSSAMETCTDADRVRARAADRVTLPWMLRRLADTPDTMPAPMPYDAFAAVAPTSTPSVVDPHYLDACSMLPWMLTAPQTSRSFESLPILMLGVPTNQCHLWLGRHAPTDASVSVGADTRPLTRLDTPSAISRRLDALEAARLHEKHPHIPHNVCDMIARYSRLRRCTEPNVITGSGYISGTMPPGVVHIKLDAAQRHVMRTQMPEAVMMYCQQVIYSIYVKDETDTDADNASDIRTHTQCALAMAKQLTARHALEITRQRKWLECLVRSDYRPEVADGLYLGHSEEAILALLAITKGDAYVSTISPVPTTTNATNATNATNGAPAVKRGRGRPRKYPEGAPRPKAAKAAKPAVPEFEFDYDLMPYKVPLAPLAKAKKATLQNPALYAHVTSLHAEIIKLYTSIKDGTAPDMDDAQYDLRMATTRYILMQRVKFTREIHPGDKEWTDFEVEMITEDNQ